MFSDRIFVTSYATPSGITRVACELPQCVSTLPPLRTTLRIATGRWYTPCAAIVEYAEAMSNGDTAIEPSPSDGTYAPSFVFSDDCTPSACAIAATLSGPTSSVRRAYT